MNKNEMRKMALLGLAAGVLIAIEPSMEATEERTLLNLDYVLAKPKCSAHGGCGGLTANRDLSNPKAEDEELNEQEESQENLSPEEIKKEIV